MIFPTRIYTSEREMYFTDQPKDSRPLKTMPLTRTARSIKPISISYCSRLRTRLPKINFRTKEILVIITRVTRIPYSSGLFTEPESGYAVISLVNTPYEAPRSTVFDTVLATLLAMK